MIKKKSTAKKTSSSILGRITPVKALELVITAVFYGRAGTGKTTLAATFPKPILVLDVGEKGTDSVFDVDDLDVLKIDTWKDVEEIYWELKNGDTKYKTVVIDALHSLQDLALLEAKKESNKDEDAQLSKRDFGIAAGAMKTWAINYRDLSDVGMNVVFLVHDRINKEEGDTEDGMISPEVGPRLMPSVAGPIMGSVKVVGHTFIRESISKPKKVGERPDRKTEYCLRLGPHSYYSTKVRNPKKFVIPDYISDASYDKLVSIMRKGQSVEPSTTRKVRKLK